MSQRRPILRGMSDWQELPIRGTLRRSIDPHADIRGSFAEGWRLSDTRSLGVAPLVQANISRSDTNVVRGMHFHLRQTDVWAMLEGRALVALVDLRDRLSGESGHVTADGSTASAQAITQTLVTGDT